MKKLLLIALLAMSLNATAENWREHLSQDDWEIIGISKSSPPSVFLMNKRDIQKIQEYNKELLLVWIKEIPKDTRKNYRVQLDIIDCHANQSAAKKITIYSNRDEVVKTITIPSHLIKMDYYAPNTIGQSIINNACGWE